jgi:hypothetical protein
VLSVAVELWPLFLVYVLCRFNEPLKRVERHQQ